MHSRDIIWVPTLAVQTRVQAKQNEHSISQFISPSRENDLKYRLYSFPELENDKLYVQLVVPQQYCKVNMRLAHASVMYEHLVVKKKHSKVIFTVCFTCVALVKYGVVLGPVRPSVHPFVRLSILKTFECLVCVICNSKNFHSFQFKLCVMIVHILKMRTSSFVHILRIFI